MRKVIELIGKTLIRKSDNCLVYEKRVYTFVKCYLTNNFYMKKIIVFLGMMTLFVFTSCSSYYYSTVKTTQNNGVKYENGFFVQENDSVRITYNFYGEDAPVHISIYNKLSEPLFVDWLRSALIVDSVAVDYKTEKVAIDGNMSTQSYSHAKSTNYYHSGLTNTISSSFDGEATLPKEVSFIPPGAKIEHTSLCLPKLNVKEMPKDDYIADRLISVDNRPLNVKSINFAESSSPIRFKSYLTLYQASSDQRKPITFTQSYYVSSVIKAGRLSPRKLLDTQSKQGNLFYVRKTNWGLAGGIVGVLAVGVILVPLLVAGPASHDLNLSF